MEFGLVYSSWIAVGVGVIAIRRDRISFNYTSSTIKYYYCILLQYCCCCY